MKCMAHVGAREFGKDITHNLSLSGHVQDTHHIGEQRKLLNYGECMLIYLPDPITLHHLLSTVKEYGD